jgi:hypothetical protein
MKKVSDYSYEVDLAEFITIVVIPKSFAESLPSVRGILDSREIPALPRPESGFSFEFTVNKDEHRLEIEGAFVGAPPGAKYEVKLRGSNGGEFSGPFITQENPIISISFTRTGGPR